MTNSNNYSRINEYENWQKTGKSYPNKIENYININDCRQHEVDDEKILTTAGRIRSIRSCFITITDNSGPKHDGKIQLYVKPESLDLESQEALKSFVLGDIIEVSGKLFYTKTGELTIKISSCRLLSMILHNYPDKYHGITNRETCYRQRYLDLMMNQETIDNFVIRSEIIKLLRDFLWKKGFLEVETPMLHTLAGGALAKPFTTHHNALNMPLFLRIAPELHLKRLLVGGLNKVFEINRNFRNEGLSTRHNPEFTMMECYSAYSKVDDMITMTQELLSYIVQKLHNTLIIPYQGHMLDFSKFKIISMNNAIKEHLPNLNLDDVNELKKYLEQKNITVTGEEIEHFHLAIFEEEIEHLLIQPTFITEYPTVSSPLARKNDLNPKIVDRFELFIGGYEIANAFSELNDPIDQASRFEEQMKAKAMGNDETMPYDEDYINALSYGLPPSAGEGIGIDRLTMILTNAASIKDVILFPLMRSENKEINNVH